MSAIRVNKLAGIIYNLYLEAAKNNSPFRAILNKIRGSIVKRLSNPIIKVRYLDRDVVMHLSSSIIESFELFPNYDRAIPKIGHLINRKNGKLNYLDIGGNVGFTVINLKEEIPNANIICIEGANYYLSLLAENIKPYTQVKIEPYFLGSDGKENLNLSLSGNATARIVDISEKKNNGTETVQTISLDNLSKKDSFIDFDCNFCKIDVDGYEVFILNGGQNFLTKFKPCLFLEWTPKFIKEHNQNPLDVATLLQHSGYDFLIFFTNLGDIVATFNTTNLVPAFEEMESKITDLMYHYDVACFSKQRLTELNISTDEIKKLFVQD